MPHPRPLPRRLTKSTLALLVIATSITAVAGEHPRLFMRAADLPRIRHACGVRADEVPADAGRFGAAAPAFQRLRALDITPAGPLLPGELTALAFVHTVDPNAPRNADRLAAITARLRKPDWITTDPLEYVIALDWCWDALDAGTRRDFLLAARDRLRTLKAGDSPLETRTFRQCVFSLALAAAVDDEDEPSPSWRLHRARLLEAARTYVDGTLPNWIEWRGLIPTTPAGAADEESLTILTVELANMLLPEDLWAIHRDTVGRWLEHYALLTLNDPAHPWQLLRDAGNGSPLHPVPEWNHAYPLTAHLLAARARDPAAAATADRVATIAAGPTARAAGAGPWAWVPIVFDLQEIPRPDEEALPTSRDLAGAVLFRSTRGTQPTVIWIEAGQPHLHPRQHFDAGHFTIYRGGYLTGRATDDISAAAVPSKDGKQRLGLGDATFDFDQYFVSPIAHNCFVFSDPAYKEHWQGKPFLPTAGQKLVGGTCQNFSEPLANSDRPAARRLAYGSSDDHAYLALDLAPACDPRYVSAYTREFFFLAGRVLVVVDRVTPLNARVATTGVFIVPSAPHMDGAPLPGSRQIQGVTTQAGVWLIDDARHLSWGNDAGQVWLTFPIRENRHVRAVGGPADRLSVPTGPLAGRRYIGGGDNSYEYVIRPATRDPLLNAWYRLGKPTTLEDGFGAQPHWGRAEIEFPKTNQPLLNIAVYVIDDVGRSAPPEVAATRTEDDGWEISLPDLPSLVIPDGATRGGTLGDWTAPTAVNPDAPLPTIDPPR